ncbi:SsgA family sporulation/cell division regulator [Streptomyces sp. S.PB5]|uniref:SsgA family sporulation/cell division regulator n=1 Tax=Streptomyces sp. S.PB5 TaxID=3020844 RepID=UPI0025AED664|nr:SsgA family sporulation/cell division regulator [Streptomyces sp. S.PB5]MDN3028559.1 SsgA family sporulation/cell division regulator [Streptomyces sp. S.PB5]
MKKCHLALTITQWVAHRLTMPMACEFIFSAKDPYAVGLIFDAEGEGPVRWVFSRELLAEGLTGMTGDGDVVLWPEYAAGGQASLWIEVGSIHTALFEIPAKPVAQWLATTYAMVPRGQEMADAEWDELTQLIT